VNSVELSVFNIIALFKWDVKVLLSLRAVESTHVTLFENCYTFLEIKYLEFNY
jgi:hypothetical protein